MCCHYFPSFNSDNKWTFLIIGAILGLVLSIISDRLRDFWFGYKHLRPRIGEYEVTLKNGKGYLDLRKARIIKVKSRKIFFEVEKKDVIIAKGEIEFVSKNYGRGYYKYINDDLFGFYEFVLLPKKQIAALRKYTTDEKSDAHKHSEAIETSFIWKKQETRK